MLSDVDRGYARDGDGITMRGRWYSEASVEHILAARLAEAEQRGAEQVLTAVEALADEWERGSNPAPYTSERAAQERLRALAAHLRDGGGSE